MGRRHLEDQLQSGRASLPKGEGGRGPQYRASRFCEVKYIGQAMRGAHANEGSGAEGQLSPLLLGRWS